MNRNLDPRTKLIFIILAAIYIVVDLSLFLESLLILIFISLFFLNGQYKYSFIFLFVYYIQLLGSYYLLPVIHHPFLIYIVSFIFNGFRLLLPGIIVGTYAVKTTTVSEWIATFKNWHFPNWLLIPIAVMLRFFPTVKEDYEHIRKAMAFRGIGTSIPELIKHPVRMLEYILIPLLMNATQVAEDLTISALTKGLSYPTKHTSIVELEWKLIDGIYLFVGIIPMILHLGGQI